MTTVTFADLTLRPRAGGYECITSDGMRLRTWQEAKGPRGGWHAIAVHLGIIASNARIGDDRRMSATPQGALHCALTEWITEVRKRTAAASRLLAEASKPSITNTIEE